MCVSIRSSVPGAVFLLVVAGTGGVGSLAAQSTVAGRLDIHISATQLAPVPGMVSVLREGEIVAQKELVLQTGTVHWFNQSFPVGSYDVRVESEGIVTEAKRGIRLVAGQKVELEFLVKSGKGVHVVEYALGGLAREEVAARLTALEAALARAESTIAQVRGSDQPSDARTAGTVKWFGDACCTITGIDSKQGIVTVLDPAGQREFRFNTSSKMAATLRVGQKIWADFAARKVSLDGGAPCCTMTGTGSQP